MNKTNDNAIEIRYDGVNNRTYEVLEKSVFSADIGNPTLNRQDEIMDIIPFRFYDGKEMNNSAEIGFVVRITTRRQNLESGEKDVILVDGERLVTEECDNFTGFGRNKNYSVTDIIGLNSEAQNIRTNGWMMFVLQPMDIKRIAEAKDVGVYIDPYNLIDANGGTINFRDGSGSFRIEGIQGAMKRAYHYFVDVTSYIDYCSSFKKQQQQILEEFEQRQEKEKQRLEQEKQKQEQQRIKQEKEQREAEALWYQAKRKYKIMLFISVAFFILCFIIGDSGFTTFLSIVSVVLFFYSMIRIMLLNSALNGDGDGGGDNFEGE